MADKFLYANFLKDAFGKREAAVRRLTPSQENYLGWIYRLAQKGPVRVRDLSVMMGVKEPSVSRAVAGLAKAGLVHHEVYGKIGLTQQGRDVGSELVRRSTCLNRLLVDILGMAPRQAAKEVHRLEHVLGDEVLLRLEVLVDFAASSPAWVKRLQHRARSEAQSLASKSEYRLGATPIHSGAAGEPESERVDV